jgi:hypothetical protein
VIAHPADVVMTAHVAWWVDEQPDRLAWILNCLARHNGGDWGDLDPDDHAANNHALRHRDARILSNYPVPAELAETSTMTPCGSSPRTSTTTTPQPQCSGRASTE